MKNCFIAKKCQSSSELSVSCCLFAGGESCLNVDQNAMSAKHHKARPACCQIRVMVELSQAATWRMDLREK